MIVPIYNAEKYLERCLNSLINQETIYQYEVILVNDGSTDHSLKIAEMYESEFSNVLCFIQENLGISAARNRGINLSSGKYIGFIDSDDFVQKSFVQELLQRAYDDDADMVKCGHYRYDAVNEKILSVVNYKDCSLVGNIGKKVLELKGFVWEGISKRTLWDDIRFPEGYWYEDIISRFLLMRKSKKIECIGKPLYYYNRHQTNISKTVWKDKSIKCLDQLYLVKYLSEYSLDSEGEDTLSYIIIHELGEVLWMRTSGLKNDIKEKMFIAARQILIEKVSIDLDYDLYENKILHAYMNANYVTWWCLCCAKMIEIKSKNDCG
ncbi:MAG: glycosyltransferase [Lachnospiraceae bacterium]|nr:glycosyltransferase [Lachnospiraceae bacterium]